MYIFNLPGGGKFKIYNMPILNLPGCSRYKFYNTPCCKICLYCHPVNSYFTKWHIDHICKSTQHQEHSSFMLNFTYSRKTEAGNFQEEQEAFEFGVFHVHVLIYNRIGLQKKIQTYNLIIIFFERIIYFKWYYCLHDTYWNREAKICYAINHMISYIWCVYNYRIEPWEHEIRSRLAFVSFRWVVKFRAWWVVCFAVCIIVFLYHRRVNIKFCTKSWWVKKNCPTYQIS